ncbi:hypothetical protein GA0074695_0518 [Micromonospora viridifaciens]|uniref:Uncharacterized protein n=1 Tax=Micromonospora viridifaciens TaxID=1881 RepID=A0A1C4UIJ2_MICVI|nr:hypothetical protein GA0074695_0518 [Micromonospora viridifaciens]
MINVGNHIRPNPKKGHCPRIRIIAGSIPPARKRRKAPRSDRGAFPVVCLAQRCEEATGCGRLAASRAPAVFAAATFG